VGGRGAGAVIEAEGGNARENGMSVTDLPMERRRSLRSESRGALGTERLHAGEERRNQKERGT